MKISVIRDFYGGGQKVFLKLLYLDHYAELDSKIFIHVVFYMNIILPTKYLQ